ncbi:hypothetical protein N665_0554s0028 [Sinapis alba]|nr:hypothetical protein N665_0554s0028 [Sinapis alba]
MAFERPYHQRHLDCAADYKIKTKLRPTQKHSGRVKSRERISSLQPRSII